MCLMLGMFAPEYNFDSKANDCVNDKNYLFEACSRQSDCGEF